MRRAVPGGHPLDVRLSPRRTPPNTSSRYSKAKTAEKMLSQLMAQGREELAYWRAWYRRSQAESEQDFNDIRAS